MIMGPVNDVVRVVEDPDDTSTTCTAGPAEIAVQLRLTVRELRLVQREHGAACNGHPLMMGHMLALRIADLLERVSS